MKRGKSKPIRPTGIQLRLPKKRIKPRVAARINPMGATTGWNQHAGEVMAFPRVRAIYWGSAYGSQASGLNQLAQSLDNFFASIFPTPYFGMLAEYQVNMPTFLGSICLPHDPASPLSINLTADFFGNMASNMTPILTSWLEADLLPEVPGRTEKNLLYIIFLSPEMTVTTSPPGCAFHLSSHFHKGSGKDNLFYAVVSSGTLGFLTGVASHELVEAFTDRSGNGWFSDDDGSEIGDICSCCSCPALTLNGFSLSSYWRNSMGMCLQQEDLLPSPPPPPSTIAGMVADTEGSPIADARVTAGNISRTTDSEGKYQLNNVPPGIHQVTATAEGYGTRSRFVATAAGQTITVDFTLKMKRQFP